MKSFAEEILAILKPERRWHYVFHLFVIILASSYWLGSRYRLPDASWAEIAMYRPSGDNQLYPAIAALSRFNLGDPTDALHYGQGTSGAQAVVLLPYVLAYKLGGAAGYMVADILLSWLYFLAITLLLRRCHLGDFASLLLGSTLAANSLQALTSKLNLSLANFLAFFKMDVWEWGMPNLLELQIFVDRIPRPMVTGIWVVLLLYFLLRQWQERRLPSLRRGWVIGALLVLLLQGDPFTLSALGLMLLWVMGWTLADNGWAWPGRFLTGAVGGVASFGWYFFWQRWHEHPDFAARFGLADYPRSELLPLPGFGPLLRVGVIGLLAGMVLLASRRRHKTLAAAPSPKLLDHRKKSRKETSDDGETTVPPPSDIWPEKFIATFFVALVAAGWLAQPAQLLLLGQGCQIYHYLVFVLPTLYSYALVILLFHFFRLALPPEWPEQARKWVPSPSWPSGVALGLILLMAIMVSMENKITTIFTNGNARREGNVPWVEAGDKYRPGFRALEKEFSRNPALQRARSFATFNHEVNFLLAGFYDKRAYLPDNGYSTLSDVELEDRLCETLKIVQIPEQHFPTFIRVTFMLNYWLGCAKYWLASDHRYASLNDYPDNELTALKEQAKQSPWSLCLPNSEQNRLVQKYTAVRNRESDRQSHPDAIIIGLEKQAGVMPNPQWYREVYTNEVFSVYVKIPPSVETSPIHDSPGKI